MDTSVSIFFDENGTLRSGWRAAIFLLAFTLAFVLLGTFLESIFVAVASLQIETEFLPKRFRTANVIAMLVSAIVIGWLCGKWLENLQFRAIGAALTVGGLKNFGVGLTIGFVTLCFAVLIVLILGGERFTLNLRDDGWMPIVWSFGVSLFIFSLASAAEEAVFRGYLLQTFERSGFAWLAILLTSIFFGAAHIGNPNAGIISTANTVLAGLWFSIAYLKTRDLWFVWGIHLMWNFAQGSVFGIEVSGLTDLSQNPILKEQDLGPHWLTGTTYGIEGGIACTIAILASLVAIHFSPMAQARTKSSE